MPLQTAIIRTILERGGLITFGSNVQIGTPMITTATGDNIVENNYVKVTLTANAGNDTIDLTRVANDSNASNAVNIRTIDALATIGAITVPGYIYTGDFSGCVFYLYKTGPHEVTGVHAYSGSQPITKRTGVLRRKVIVQEVREYGPSDFYLRTNGGTQLCRYPTRGELNVQNGEISLGFLSCVDVNTATTFLFAVAGSPQGSRVRRLLKTYHVRF
jgi:hypothetical protein